MVEIRYDIAWCPPCIGRHTFDVHRISQLLKHPDFAPELHTASGITWFIPRVPNFTTIRSLASKYGLTGLYLALPFDPWGNQIHHEPGHFDPTLLADPCKRPTPPKPASPQR